MIFEQALTNTLQLLVHGLAIAKMLVTFGMGFAGGLYLRRLIFPPRPPG
jgi:hypothetical protein